MAIESKVNTVVVGAGASGLLTVAHLHRLDRSHRIALIDSRPQEDVGIAYSTREPGHLMNVRSGGLSAFESDTDHFVRWVADRKGTCDPHGFEPRGEYGEYLRDVANAVGSSVDRYCARAESLEFDSDGVVIVLSDNRRIVADQAVLALGNALPIPISGKGRQTGSAPEASPVIDDPWEKGSLASINPDDTVVLVGTGLTAVDIAVSLSERSHRGPIIAISTGGEWPRRHVPHPAPVSPTPVQVGMPLRDVVRLVHIALDEARASGGDWRQVIDGLRPATIGIWAGWSDEDRRRFVRLLRQRWDLHRHRMAPSVADHIERMEKSGILERRSGRVIDVGPSRSGDGRINVQLADGECLDADRVVNCTGPSPSLVDRKDPLIDSLVVKGLARPGWNRWGLDVDPGGHIIDVHGEPVESVFVVGPLRIGAEWESTAIPELRRQADFVARQLISV